METETNSFSELDLNVWRVELKPRFVLSGARLRSERFHAIFPELTQTFGLRELKVKGYDSHNEDMNNLIGSLSGGWLETLPCFPNETESASVFVEDSL